jgi:type IV pilus assembly protein PilW
VNARRARHALGHRQAGFSLIELLIAMVIGLIVIGAVLASYLGSRLSSRQGHALTQITEDAAIAFNVLRSGISMVGYGAPTGVGPDGRFTKAYTGQGLFGCDAAFADPSKPMAALACEAAGAADAIAVAYEADAWNSVVNNDVERVPLDCLGNTLTKAANPDYLNYSRFYVDNGQLFCRGPGNHAAAALVDNVVDMQVMYGVANRVDGSPDTYGVARYADATAMGGQVDVADWRNVVAVRICLVLRSADNVLDDPMPYQGCRGAVDAKPGDRHLYRAFTTTIVLQNRLGAVL